LGISISDIFYFEGSISDLLSLVIDDQNLLIKKIDSEFKGI